MPGKITPGYSDISIGDDYGDEDREFLTAMDRYKRANRRPYPTWREVLGVVKSLGYRKIREEVLKALEEKDRQNGRLRRLLALAGSKQQCPQCRQIVHVAVTAEPFKLRCPRCCCEWEAD